MKYVNQLATVLAVVTLVNGQYGPLKGSATRRTTTPFPPGFQSDNEIYNGPSGKFPSNNLDNQDLPSKGNLGPGQTQPGSPGSQPPGYLPPGNFGTPGIGHGSHATPNKTPSTVTNLDNPWLKGVVSGASKPGSTGCFGGGVGCGQPSSPALTPFPDGKVTAICNAPGFGCVQKHQCQGGQTSSPGSGVS